MSKYRRRLMSYSRISPVCDDSNYMYVIANNSSATNRVLSFSGGDIEYTIDGGITWNILSVNTDLTLPKSKKVYFKARLVPNSSIGIGTFTMAGYGYFTVGGNLLSLIYKDRAKGIKSLANLPYAFYRLFYKCRGLGEVASDLLSEYTTLSNYCYKEMFYNTYLVTPPNVLPAKTVLTQSYYSMFGTCWYLTKTPTIDATSIGSSGCYQMFYSCWNLTEASSIVAKSIGSSGCYSMFSNCDLLTTMPSISATSISSSGCYSMFYNCSSLVTAPKFVPTSLAGNSTLRGMFYGCSALSNVEQLDLSKISSYGGQFGCSTMFYGCSSLTTAPKLPSCDINTYNAVTGMFQNCSSLTYVKILAKKILTASYVKGMLSGVSTTGTFVHYPRVDWSSVIPSGWTVQTATS